MICPYCNKPLTGNAFVIGEKAYHPHCAPIPHSGAGVPFPSHHIPNPPIEDFKDHP